MESIILQYLNR